jgi:cell division protein FtsX
MKDAFMVAATGLGTAALATIATFALCWSIPQGSWLAVHNVDLLAEYGSVLIAPAVGLISGAAAGIASYRHLRDSYAPGPR